MADLVSASPVDLGVYSDGHTAEREGFASRATSTQSQSSAVISASESWVVESSHLGTLTGLTGNWEANELFVKTIRDELLKADADTNGIATTSAANVASALEANGANESPSQLQVSESALAGTPPSSGFVDDPINAAVGNFIHYDHDVRFPALSAALDLTRFYNSLRSARPGAFGPGWWSVVDVTLRVTADGIEVDLADGATESFAPLPHGDAAPENSDVPQRWQGTVRHGHSITAVDGGYEMRTDQIRRWRFDAEGQLTGWTVGVAEVLVERVDGRVVALRNITTGRSLALTWTGDAVSSVETDAGRRVSYFYEPVEGGAQRLRRVESPAGWFDYEYDDGGRLYRAVDPDGVTQFDNRYDEVGRVTSQVSPFGRLTSYRYELGGTTTIRDQAGTKQAMIHDDRGNLIAVVDHDGSAMRMTYDHLDRVVQTVERDGSTWINVFDDDDHLVECVDPDGRSRRWVYDDLGRIVESIDRAGRVTIHQFDTDFEAASRVIGPDGAVASQELNELGLPVEITDADGVVTRFEWDRDGQPSKVVNALGEATVFEYDDGGLLRELLRPVGAATEMSYDAGGRVVKAVRGDAVAEYSYSPAGRPTGGVEPGGVPWVAEYGPHGVVAAVTDAEDGSVRFDYDDQGNITKVTAADGGEYTNRYDPVGRHIASSDAGGATTTKGYDVCGRVISVTDANDNTWHRVVDAFGRTVESVDPLGGVTRYAYTPDSQIETVTTPDGRRWRNEYDAAGRLVAAIAPGGGRAEMWYTAAGRLAGRRSPAGRTETYTYDSAGRLETITGIDGETRYLTYDGAGRLLGVDSDGQIVEFDRDEVGRVIGASVDGEWWRYGYDGGGRNTSRIDPTGAETRFGFDSRGLLSQAIDPSGGTIDYSYDARGRLAGQATPFDRDMEFGYDAAGRMSSWTDPDGGVTSFDHDPAGNLVSARYPDGSGWERSLDALGRQTELHSLDDTILESFSYDAGGRLIEAVSNVGTSVGFLWDDNGRLVGETTAAGETRFVRDDDGWITEIVRADGSTIAIERNEFGVVTSVGGTAVADPQEHDRAGRLLLGPNGIAYRYDEAGRLAEVAPPTGDPTVFHYGDDGLIDFEEGPNGTRRFSYDGAGQVVQIDIDRIGTTRITYDGAGRRSVEYRWDGSIVRYEWDGLGRLGQIVTTRSDGTASQATVVYDALGRPSIVDGVPVISSGLVAPVGGVPVGDVRVMGARVLDPATHQFLSPDPLLAQPGSNGSASAYTYAWHDPVNFVDPDGLRPVSTEEYAAIREREEQGRVGQAWQAIKEDPWGTVAMVGVVAAGVGLMFVPGGQAIGAGILISAAMTGGVGFATGNFDPRATAVSGVFGAIPGGAATSLGRTVAVGAATSAGETVVQSVVAGNGFPPPGQLLTDTLIGAGSAGALNGGGRLLNGAAGDAVRPGPAAGGGAHHIVPSNSSPVNNAANTLNPPNSSAAVAQHTPTPTRSAPLALEASRYSNPWMPGEPIVSRLARPGERIQMVVDPEKDFAPGMFGTPDPITSISQVRNDLAVLPEWKPDPSVVQEFEIPAGVRIQEGIVGPQTQDGILYPGGGRQVMIVDPSDKLKLKPIGDRKIIE